MNKYTVLVLRPAYIADDYGQDTCQVWSLPRTYRALNWRRSAELLRWIGYLTILSKTLNLVLWVTPCSLSTTTTSKT